MGYYDKDDAREIALGLWMQPDRLDFSRCYSASDAFEQAILDAKGAVVGKVTKGFTTFPPKNLSSFGLHYRVRRIADVDEILARVKAKRKRDHEARQAAKSYQSVTMLTYDRDWNLTEKTVESRTVYTNKSGGMVIKTRSNGSPKVHLVDGKYVVVYYPHKYVTFGGDEHYKMQAAKEIPAECPVLDNL